jgi:hypothetical protein
VDKTEAELAWKGALEEKEFRARKEWRQLVREAKVVAMCLQIKEVWKMLAPEY